MERKGLNGVTETREAPLNKLGQVLLNRLKKFWHDNIIADTLCSQRMQSVDEEVSIKLKPPTYKPYPDASISSERRN